LPDRAVSDDKHGCVVEKVKQYSAIAEGISLGKISLALHVVDDENSEFT